MKILFAGDIVGAPGRTAFARTATQMRGAGEVDFVVANAENAAGGNGLIPRLAEELFAGGADVLTMGDHVWDQKELIPYIDKEPRILRPANLSPACPGKGWITIDIKRTSISVINLLGRVFMAPSDCPFRAVDEILRNERMGNIVLVDVHAEATSEKIAMGRFLDGRAAAVVGSHTHVQTSDEKILPGGTAYITDMGMTGPSQSILGREIEPVLHRFVTGMPSRFKVASEEVVFEGVLIDVVDQTGMATNIRRIRETTQPNTPAAKE